MQACSRSPPRRAEHETMAILEASQMPKMP
jgi:hypothetical protein